MSVKMELYMKDLPEAAILHIEMIESLTVTSKKSKAPTEKTAVIGWANLRMVDWRSELVQGTVSFHFSVLRPEVVDYQRNAEKGNPNLLPKMWRLFAWETVNLWGGDVELPPNGRVGPNDYRQGDPKSNSRLRLTFSFEPAKGVLHVRMPQRQRYEDFIRHHDQIMGVNRSSLQLRHMRQKATDIERVHVIMRKRLLGETLDDDEKQHMWDMRYYSARYIPDALIVLCDCELMWRKREHFAEIFFMLYEWERISVGAALTILGERCLDPNIRRFAVEQLDAALDNNSFPLFILPLIQALKYEPFACSDLASLLLKRSLFDYRIGHKLFWLLRAELVALREAPDGGVSNELFKRLALLIEAYLRGNEDHIRTIIKQVEMVEHLSTLSTIIKTYRDKDSATKRLREELRDRFTSMENVDSPLDPTSVLGDLIIDKCKVLGSAKMPLRLTWKNVNPMSQCHLPTYEIIYKKGDDLRQDMLVLHVLDLMDSIWKRNLLDCCLNVYPVLPTGTKVGMIGVVPRCATIFEIQSEGGKVGTAVKSLETTFINKYVRNQAGASKEYFECVDRFLMSCVGYSVATFIMGIKDRHNDNIMMTRDGRLFHIDFGHILGHGKTKLGIQRDRVPFVLTEHFLNVIGKGKPVTKEGHEVQKFRNLCRDAYLVLWDAKDLFLSLFTVMQSMELPELSTEADLAHLKKTLAMNCEDQGKAGSYFDTVFEDAFNGSWSTKTNWFFHTVKHL